MLREKPMNCFLKRKEFFTEVWKQDLPKSEATTLSELDTLTPCYPAKKKCSLDKNNGTIHLKNLNIQWFMQEEWD